jgi:AmmeMemoRadiSam system protein A
MNPADADHALGKALLQIARSAIEQRLSGAPENLLQVPAWDLLPILAASGASFVTLHKGGQLRGCIGSLEARRPLREDVQENALAAAFRDARFPAVSSPEWPSIALEVSLLSAPERLDARREEELCARLRPHIDGVILTCRSHRATFLPQVWAQLPEPETFIAQLKHKAGLAASFWSPEVEIERYQVRHWSES